MEIIENIPLCPVCGKPVKIGKRGFWKYCSISCGTKAQRANKELEKKYKETCIKKYGVDNPAKAKSVIEKAKQTCIEKYGGTSPMHSVSVRNIKYKHQQENNTFNTSYKEEDSYDLLKTKYNTVIRQYTSEKYPFNCDFYIPDLDLYIECNYHWTHGKEPFDGNINNPKLIEWTEKSNTSKFYKNAIETWCIRDVNKRNTAKENNLNFIEFWNINELKLWLT